VNANAPPNVLVLAGLDPSGGAGVQADIETLRALGAHTLPLVTCLTVQDTCNVHDVQPVAADWLRSQARVLLADMPIAAGKIGLLGSADMAQAAAEIVTEVHALHPRAAIVLDPVLTAGGGARLADGALLQILRKTLLPRVTLLTPNGPEALALAGMADDVDDLDRAARVLLELGCPAVLVTGGHAQGNAIHNVLYQMDLPPQSWHWPRLDGEYHGTGCTLAAACAAGLAHGLALVDAVQQAQQFTAHAVRQSFPAGRGQWIPGRWQ